MRKGLSNRERTEGAERGLLVFWRTSGGKGGRERRGSAGIVGRGRERRAFRSGSMEQGSQGERSSGAWPRVAQTVRSSVRAVRMLIPFFVHVPKRIEIQAARGADQCQPESAGPAEVLPARDLGAEDPLARLVVEGDFRAVEEEREAVPGVKKALDRLPGREG